MYEPTLSTTECINVTDDLAFICSTSAIPNLMYKLGTGRKFSQLHHIKFLFRPGPKFSDMTTLITMFTHSSNKHVLI